MYSTIVALILSITAQEQLPPYFVLSIALVENPTLNTEAIHFNNDGTNDAGVMQLNSRYFGDVNRWDPAINIRVACIYIRQLIQHNDIKTWWDVAIAYNCGPGRVLDPPWSTLDYASAVMVKYTELSGGYVRPLIMYNFKLRRYE